MEALETEKFYVPLVARETPNGPNALRTRLQQCIRQREAAFLEQTHAKLKASATYYNEKNNNEDVVSLDDVRYNERKPHRFKHRIIRGSSSFSTLAYRSHPAGTRNYQQ